MKYTAVPQMKSGSSLHSWAGHMIPVQTQEVVNAYSSLLLPNVLINCNLFRLNRN